MDLNAQYARDFMLLAERAKKDSAGLDPESLLHDRLVNASSTLTIWARQMMERAVRPTIGDVVANAVEDAGAAIADVAQDLAEAIRPDRDEPLPDLRNSRQWPEQETTNAAAEAPSDDGAAESAEPQADEQAQAEQAVQTPEVAAQEITDPGAMIDETRQRLAADIDSYAKHRIASAQDRVRNIDIVRLRQRLVGTPTDDELAQVSVFEHADTFITRTGEFATVLRDIVFRKRADELADFSISDAGWPTWDG